MSYAPRSATTRPASASTSTSIRQSILASANLPQASALVARVAAKRQELENLKQLNDLSRTLATQISALETKLATLRDGTEAVAYVLANWDNVLRAINMASMKVTQLADGPVQEPAMPVTLVRIPVQEAKAAEDINTNGR